MPKVYLVVEQLMINQRILGVYAERDHAEQHLAICRRLLADDPVSAAEVGWSFDLEEHDLLTAARIREPLVCRVENV